MSEVETLSRLQAAIAARREAALALVVEAQRVYLELQDPRCLGKHQPGWYLWPRVEEMAGHVVRVCDRDLKVLERHRPSLAYAFDDTFQCEHCASLCHGDGYGCKDPDAPYPCLEVRVLVDGYPEARDG